MTHRPPNILFIFNDDQRFDTIAALGNSEIDTPNFDRLVARGTAFTHAHIMGSMAEAVCIASRAMMLTGRGIFSLQGAGHCIPADHITLPEHLRQQGYITAHVGKWHQDRASHARSFSTGAKIFGFRSKQGWYEDCNGHWHIPVHDYDPSGIYDGQGGYNDPTVAPYEAPFETTKSDGRHSVEVFGDATIDFLRSYPSSAAAAEGKPFCLYLANIAPHDPRQYPEHYKERYHAEAVSLPPNFVPQHPFDNGEMLVRDELLEAHPRRPGAIRQHLADYYAIIALIDDYIGRILDAVDESGLADSTIIAFSCDHGLAVGQHGLMGKQNLYDHSLRIPLIFAGPGIPAGLRCDSLCCLPDIFPTLCELSGQPIPATVEGRSLVPALHQPNQPLRDCLHFAYKDVQRAVRVGDWKLIEYVVEGRSTTQLFDLASDPWETHDRCQDADCQDLLASLRQRLHEWPNTLGDTRAMGQRFWSGVPWAGTGA